MASTDDSRFLRAFGRELIEVHDELRDHLAALQDGVRRGRDVDDRSIGPRSLRTHCLVFCRALRAHHEGEDAGTFPVLAKIESGLREAIDDLMRDHDFIAGILDQLESMATRWREGHVDDLDRFERELDGLAAVLENHLSYEERALVDLLDGIGHELDDPGRARVATALHGPWRDALATPD